jgi:hypothetical protein
MAIQGDTDCQATRERRSKLLHGLLAGLFEKKCERRGFSPGATPATALLATRICP